MSVVRGRPPGLAGGISGASRAYCSSLRACPAPKSPTSARLSVVHMACLQEGLLPSRTGRRPACATRSPRRRRLLKRPLSVAGAAGTFKKTRIAGFSRPIVAIDDSNPDGSKGQGLPWRKIVDCHYIADSGQQYRCARTGVGRKMTHLKRQRHGIAGERLSCPSALAEGGEFGDVGFSQDLRLNDPAQGVALPCRALFGPVEDNFEDGPGLRG